MNPVRLIVVYVLALTAGLAGCGSKQAEDKPELPEGADLVAVAQKARADAAAACAAGDAGAARKAAALATAALARAQSRAATGPAQAAVPATGPAQAGDGLRLIEAAAREAGRLAELAEEKAALAAKLAGWKARTYRGARNLAVRAATKALALAADAAAGADPNALPAEARRAAAEAIAGLPRLPDGRADWKAVGASCSAMADQPPPELGLALAVAFASAGHGELALYEVAAFDPTGLAEPRMSIGGHVLRGVVYKMNDLPRLAGEDFASAAGKDPATAGEWYGPELRGSVHLLLAANAGRNKDWRQADLEVMRATQLWPNNPIGVLLTGEVMVAEGKYEKAATSIENLLGPEAPPWLVEHIRQRARQIRDGKGAAEPLFHDAGFQRCIAWACLREAARTSQAARKLEQYVDSVESFGAECLKHLPQLGGSGGGKSKPKERPK